MIQANTNNRWARLSQSEKAELLGIYASKGYHDLANIIAHYNSCGGKLYPDGGPETFSVRDNTRISFTPQSIGYLPAIERPIKDRSNIRLDDGVIGYLPFAGDALQGGQAISDFFNGDYGKAAIGAGLLFLPNIIEKTGKVGVRLLRNNNIRNVGDLYHAAEQAVIHGSKRNKFMNTEFENYPEFAEFLQRTGMEPSQKAVDEFAKVQGTSVRGTRVSTRGPKRTAKDLGDWVNSLSEEEKKGLTPFSMMEFLDYQKQLSEEEISKITDFYLTHSPYHKDAEVIKKMSDSNMIGADALLSNGIYSSNSMGVAKDNASIDKALAILGERGYVGDINIPLIYDKSLPLENQVGQIMSNTFNYDDIISGSLHGAYSMEGELSRAAEIAGYKIGDHAYTTFKNGLPIHERTTLGPDQTANLINKTEVRPDLNSTWNNRYGLRSQPLMKADSKYFIPKVTTERDIESVADILSWLTNSYGNPIFNDGGKLYGNGGPKKRETSYARKYREEQIAKTRRAIEHPTLSNVFRNDTTDNNEKYYDIVKSRYYSIMGALRRKGFSYDDASRLAPMMVTQNVLEGGWRMSRPDNNFGGMQVNGRFLSFDSPDEYYDAYIDMLDQKWGQSKVKSKNWRNAENLNDWARIVNHEDLNLWSEERYNAYTEEHPDESLYLYAPEWQNNYKPYRQHLAGVEPRVNTYLDMVFEEDPYTKEMYDAPVEPIAQPNDKFNLSMDQFQKLLESNKSKGNMAEGGRLYGDGGPEKTYQDYLNEYNAAEKAWKDANSAASKANKERWEYYDSLPSSVKYSPNFHWKNIPGLRQRIEKEEQLEEEAEKRRSEYYKAGAAIGEATVEKYRGTKHDLLKYPDWARTEEGAINYLVNDYIRESAGAQEVADYFNSYALSPGFQRIIDNQWQWGHDRHPYKRIYDFANYGKKGFTSSAERMRTSLTELPMTTDGVFDMNAVPGMGFNVTGPGYHFIINTAAQPYNQEDERFPYWFELTHEMMHDRNFFSSGQGEALDQNTNADPGHDSRGNEKHSDLEALRFMLFKEGIYDSRGEKDCTPEDIAKMRKKWPNLRPLQQMDDEKAAWMINHVADAGNQESLYDNHLGNISANGGKIHIKPENRGKFTALKERTGHSASWFKEHGTPAQKKMAVFALNARKWKHEDGGPLREFANISDLF